MANDSCFISQGTPFDVACDPEFWKNFQIVSSLVCLTFALLFGFTLKAVGYRLIYTQARLHSKDSLTIINFLACFTLLAGVAYSSNMYGFHWDDNCHGLIAGDLITSGFYVITYLIVDSAQRALFENFDSSIRPNVVLSNDDSSQNSQPQAVSTAPRRPIRRRSSVKVPVMRSRGVKGFIEYATPYVSVNGLFATFTIVFPIISRPIWCYQQENRNQIFAVMLLCYAIGGSYLVSQLIFFLILIGRKIKATDEKSEFDSIEIKKLKGTRIRQFFFSFMMSVTTLYQIYYAYSIAWKHDDVYYTDISSDVLSPHYNLFLIIQIIAALTVSVNYRGKGAKELFGQEASFSKNSNFTNIMKFRIQALIIVYNMLAPPATFALALIWDGYFREIIVCSMMFQFITMLLVVPTLEWGRDGELSACIAYKTLRYDKLLFKSAAIVEMCLEILSFLYISTPNIILWWGSSSPLRFIYAIFDNKNSALNSTSYSLTLTNLLILYMVFLGLMQIFVKFVHIPKTLLTLNNFLADFTYDIAILTINSIMMQRLYCQQEINGLLLPNDSLFQNGGNLIGDPVVICDAKYDNVMSFSMYSLGLIFFVDCWGFSYISIVKNTATKPRVWEMSGFGGLKFILKCILVLTISVCPTSWIYSPWIRSGAGTVVCCIITYLSYIYLPLLGPKSKDTNIFRTTGYALALSFNITSLISLICNQIASENLAIIITAIFVFLLPFTMCTIIYKLTQRRAEKILTNVKAICKIVDEEKNFMKLLQLYQTALLSTSTNEQASLYGPVLAMTTSPEIKSSIKTNFDTFLVSDAWRMRDAQVHNTLEFVSCAMKFNEGLSETRRHFTPYLININKKCLDILEVMPPFVSELTTNNKNVYTYMLKSVIKTNCNILTAIAKYSKFNQMFLQEKDKNLLLTLLALHNLLIIHENASKQDIFLEALVAIRQCIESLKNLAINESVDKEATESNDIHSLSVFLIKLVTPNEEISLLAKKCVTEIVFAALPSAGMIAASKINQNKILPSKSITLSTNGKNYLGERSSIVSEMLNDQNNDALFWKKKSVVLLSMKEHVKEKVGFKADAIIFLWISVNFTDYNNSNLRGLLSEMTEAHISNTEKLIVIIGVESTKVGTVVERAFQEISKSEFKHVNLVVVPLEIFFTSSSTLLQKDSSKSDREKYTPSESDYLFIASHMKTLEKKALKILKAKSSEKSIVTSFGM